MINSKPLIDPLVLIAFRSLSEVPTLKSVCSNLVAVNINAGGTISFLGFSQSIDPFIYESRNV